ncbi:MAG: hypothetical protein KAS32_05870 [Candidatus Peribacteraceae bacterium]|nr:hypothetical protein [Candidatus Peribacteraceae bacterium]
MESPCRGCEKYNEHFPSCTDDCNSLKSFRKSTIEESNSSGVDPTESYRFSGMSTEQKDFFIQNHISDN